MEFEYEVIHKE